MNVLSTVPSAFRKIVVHTKSTNFRAATSIVTQNFPLQLRPHDVVVKNRFVGINASDINYTVGVYKPGVQVPFDCGFESIGNIVGTGEAVTSMVIGDPVIVQSFGAFSEYQKVSLRTGIIHKVDRVDPSYLALQISGVTAFLALKHQARPRAGETALVTAAAGATGHFAVQLLRNVYNCRVVATCSSPAKKEFLEGLGCHRVVNYKTEDLDEVLRREFRSSVNVVYESAGGRLFETALRHLATKGRLVTIGSMSGYADGSSFSPPSTADSQLPLNTYLLLRSGTIAGFFLLHFAKHQSGAMLEMEQLMNEGTIKCVLDPSQFRGIDSVVDAVEYLQSGASIGKVIAELTSDLPGLDEHF